jgi:hypothetical protein
MPSYCSSAGKNDVAMYGQGGIEMEKNGRKMGRGQGRHRQQESLLFF